MTNTIDMASEKFIDRVTGADAVSVNRALSSHSPGITDFCSLISKAAENHIEEMASVSQRITRRHFGRTISLYAPLYLSNFCNGGCAYCGFASDRKQHRSRLEQNEISKEIASLKEMGFEDVLLLTGERCKEADFDYLCDSVRSAASVFHNVTVESFAMTEQEYVELRKAGCTGVTLYQETYDRELYSKLHRWGEKTDYNYRIEAPARALKAGLRTAGMGVLLGLAEPELDILQLFLHADALRKRFWQGGVMISFPRICNEQGNYSPAYPVSDRKLAQFIFAFRICMPDVPLVLSTRESAAFRDGMAGLGICRMSVGSRTTVGGYHPSNESSEMQFSVNDCRDVDTFCEALRKKHLQPVFKNWDSVFQMTS